MTLALLSLLGVQPARAQWNVTDKAGDILTPNQDGSGYPLRGPMTGTYTLSQPYQDVLDASNQPNPTVEPAFDPGPWSYQRWLYGSDPATSGSGTSSSGGGSTSPGGDYDPYHIWTEVDAPNYATTSYNKTGYLGTPWNENINGTISTSTGGTLWAVFQWTDPYGYYGPPPAYIKLLLTTTVTAGVGPQGNGLTSSATATDSTYNETAGAPGGVSTVKGRHLLRVPVDPNTGKASVSLGGTTTATASNSLPYGAMQTYSGTTYQYYQTTNGPADASASAHIGATVGFDSREVSITSPTIEDSYYKGAYDSQHGTDRYLHQRNTDGSIQTDSVAFYGTADNNHGWNASANFAANTPGFTNPTYSWSSDFNPVAMLGVDTHQSSIAGGWYFGGANTLPKSSTVTLNVQDGPGTDNAQASNTFDIKWHLPYEAPNPVPYLVMAGKYSLQPARLGPVPDGQTSLAQSTQPKHIDWDATIDGAAVVAKRVYKKVMGPAC